MKIVLALILGAIIGAGGFWLYASRTGGSKLRPTRDQVENTAKAAKDAIETTLRVRELRPQDIKEDLAQGGQVVRRKAREAGKAIADATADARTTSAIKAKLLAEHSL